MKIRLASLAIALAVLPLTAAAVAQETAPAKPPAEAAAPGNDPERESRLQAMLDGARLVGQFTVIGADGTSRPPQAEQYAVSNLQRDAEGRWVFNVSMSYGTQQHTMPVPVTIEWAADTPMITMTEQTIPGLGTFTARVLIYDGLYAGTWKHGQFGGHMYGKIESGGSIPAPVPPPPPAPPASAPDGTMPQTQQPSAPPPAPSRP